MKELKGKKKISGYIWAGPGNSWRKKGNYFKVDDNEKVSACFEGPSGSYWIRFNGGTCVLTAHDKDGHRLGRTAIILPGGKKKDR